MNKSEVIDQINVFVMKYHKEMSTEMMDDVIVLVHDIRHGEQTHSDYDQYLESALRG